MTLGSAGLIKLLASAAMGRAGGARAAAPSADDKFASLLDRARAGGVSSGQSVSIDGLSGVTLTPDQLERLAVAADRAEANGAHRALVLIDGQALTLDVGLRQVTGRADLSGGRVLTGIDAIVSVPSADGSTADAAAGSPSVLPLPRGDAAPNPSLLKLLRDRPPGPGSGR